MAKVWKFNLKPHDNRIEMPCGAKLMSVAFQGNDLKLWAQIEDGRTPEIRLVRVVGTGHEIDAADRFVGTAFHPIGLVFHVFDCGTE